MSPSKSQAAKVVRADESSEATGDCSIKPLPITTQFHIMQTFLPYRDFTKSMQSIDPKRLGNQVYREGVTLLRGGWVNHPVAKMWANYKDSLASYLWQGVLELQRRGHDYIDRPWALEIKSYDLDTQNHPTWLGDERLHSSHRANLLRKDLGYYAQHGWKEDPTTPYYWPDVNHTSV